MDSPVWLITGCSSGLGHAIAKAALARGGRAIVTARSMDAARALAATAPGRAVAVPLDVTQPEQIRHAVELANEQFGRVDVLVNNAGYGYQASAEEGDEAEIRQQFDTNVFGLFALTRAVLPGMRQRRRGHVFNITSIAGLFGLPGSGYYAASKHAVEGWSDSLAAEVKPLGIHVTCVEPGPFRTDWAGRSLRATESTIADYADTVAARMQRTKAGSGRQPGDPDRAAAMIVDMAMAANSPRHLVLGTIGRDLVLKAMQAKLDEIQAWGARSGEADYPGP